MKGLKTFFTAERAALILGCSDFLPETDSRQTSSLSQSFKVDSRYVTSGDVFVALRGKRDDGHKYIKSAIEAGAAAIMLENTYYTSHLDELSRYSVVYLPVSDSESALIRLAAEWLNEVSPKAVGITGSVGKTTTRELLCGALKSGARVHSAVKSYNTLTGCSMTILSMPRDTEILILELGTNHPGEIAELVQNFPVTNALITEVAPSHLEGLKSLDGVLAAKMEITKSKTLEVLSYNADNVALSAAVNSLYNESNEKRVKTIGVGRGAADIRVSDICQRMSLYGEARLEFTISVRGENFQCSSPVFGRQHAQNFAFAFAAARELGADVSAVICSFENVELPPGRGRVYRCTGGGIIIDDSYNANPASLSAALKNLSELECEQSLRRVAVLGAMRELGDASDYWHTTVLNEALALGKVDAVYLLGDEWGSLESQSPAVIGRWRCVDDFIAELNVKSLTDGAVVLLKGSRYYELEKLLPFLPEDKAQL